jgi:hypothetical protein
VGDKHRYQKLLRKVVEWMLAHHQFANVPASVFEPAELGALTELIDEDVFLRKDLSTPTATLDDDTEVVGFTFDELRDFLLSDYVLNVVLKQSEHAFEETVERLTKPSSSVAEGVSQYLFFACRHTGQDAAHKVIQKQDWYDRIFVPCIFDMEQDNIANADIEKLKGICLSEEHRAQVIVGALLVRYDTRIYPKTNIKLLFEIFDTMTDEQFTRLVVHIFTRSRSSYEVPYYPISKLAEDLQRLLLVQKEHWYEEYTGLAELLLYLWKVTDEDERFPARELYSEFAAVYSELANNLAATHVERQRKGFRGGAIQGFSIKRDGSTMFPTKRRSGITLRKTGMGVVVCYTRRPLFAQCKKKAGVHDGSYAEEFLQRTYEWYINSAIDLKTEFAKYYQPEYRNMKAFLYVKRGCTFKDIKALKKDLESSKFIGLIPQSLGWDGRIQSFFNIDNADQIAAEILGAKWENAT